MNDPGRDAAAPWREPGGGEALRDRRQPLRRFLTALGWTPAALPPGVRLQGALLLPALTDRLRSLRLEHDGGQGGGAGSRPLSGAEVREVVRRLRALDREAAAAGAPGPWLECLLRGVVLDRRAGGAGMRTRRAVRVPLIDWADASSNRWAWLELPRQGPPGGTRGPTRPLLCLLNGIVVAAIDADDGNARGALLRLALADGPARCGPSGLPAAEWTPWSDALSRDAQAVGPRLPDDAHAMVAAVLAPQRLLAWLGQWLLRRPAGRLRLALPSQVGAVQAVLGLARGRPDELPRDGTLFHPQGGGRRTMLRFLLQAFLRDPALARCRLLLLVQDPEFALQLADRARAEFEAEGPVPAAVGVAGTGRALARLVGEGGQRVVLAPVAKLPAALSLAACRLDSAHLLVVLEAAPTGISGAEALDLRDMWPRAACVLVRDPSPSAGRAQGSAAGASTHGARRIGADGFGTVDRAPFVLGIREEQVAYLHEPFDAAACLGLFRAWLGERRLEATGGNDWEAEAVVAAQAVEDARRSRALRPRDAEAAVRRALLPRLHARVGLADARLLMERILDAADLAARSG